MAVKCVVKNCNRKGKHRIKNISSKYPNLLKNNHGHDIPRICEVHYSNIKNQLQSDIDEHEEFQCVEYLEEFLDVSDTDLRLNVSTIQENTDNDGSNEENFTNVEYLEEYVDASDKDLELNLSSVQECSGNIKSNEENDVYFDCQPTTETSFLSEYRSRLMQQLEKSFNGLWRVFLFITVCLMVISNLINIEIINDAWYKIQQNQVHQIKSLQRENRALKMSAKSHGIRFERQTKNFKKRLASIFNDDQIDMLYRNLVRPAKWSDETILKSLKTKFACNKRGYIHLIRETYPLPSTRTLRERMEGLDFHPGILNDVFLFLNEKVKSFNECERECQIVVDEMSIIAGKQYDIGSQSHIGEITLPLAQSKDSTLATHALTFMVVGLSTRYKQIVAYHLTGNSMIAPHFRETIIEITKKSWNIGLKVNGVTNDMGGSDTALWKLWGIKATRKGKIINSIPHPCDPSRSFWIIGDVPHLLKRIVQGILNNGTIVFDDYVVKTYNLNNNTVQSNDFFSLFDVQKDDQLKLSPKLKSHILSPNNFQKMNVPVSTNLIGSNVSTSLHYLYSQLTPTEQKQSTFQTTAWFCQVLNRWFKLTTSRHIALILSSSTYDEIAGNLNDVMDIIKHTKFGSDGKWKPFQRGILVTSKSLLEMSEFLLTKRKFKYFLPGRVAQDCVENLFSTVRSGNPKPNAIQVQHCIKNISISEYL